VGILVLLTRSGLIKREEENLKQVYSEAKRIYANWDETLSRESTVDRETVRKQLRHYSVSSAGENLKASKAIYLAVDAGLVLQFAIGAAVVTLLSIEFNIPAPKNGAPHPTIIIATASFLLTLGAGRGLLTKSGWPRLALSTAYLLGAAGFLLAAALLINQPNSVWHISRIGSTEDDKLTAVAALSLGISLAINTIAAVLEFAILFSCYIRPLAKQQPEVMMIKRLMILLSLATDRTGLSDTKAKVSICKQLQYSASWLRNEFSKSVATSDPRINTILAERFGRSAAYLDEMQLRVVFADEKAMGELRETVARCITTILRGEYDLLPYADSTVAKRRIFWYVTTAIRTVIIGAIPIGCIIGIRYAGLSPSTEFSNWASVVAVGWAAITTISAIDPLYKARLADIRDFIASVRGSGNQGMFP
jgi:hypothetical protein